MILSDGIPDAGAAGEGARSALLITCVDGRIQIPLQTWVRTSAGVDFADTITEPGADLILSIAYGTECVRIQAVARTIALRRPPRAIVVAGHHDCLANPVHRHRHLDEIQSAVATVSGWRLAPLIVGVWMNERWEVEEVQRRHTSGEARPGCPAGSVVQQGKGSISLPVGRAARLVGGGALLLVGAILVPTPILTGTPFILGGLALLAPDVPWAARLLESARARLAGTAR